MSSASSPSGQLPSLPQAGSAVIASEARRADDERLSSRATTHLTRRRKTTTARALVVNDIIPLDSHVVDKDRVTGPWSCGAVGDASNKVHAALRRRRSTFHSSSSAADPKTPSAATSQNTATTSRAGRNSLESKMSQLRSSELRTARTTNTTGCEVNATDADDDSVSLMDRLTSTRVTFDEEGRSTPKGDRKLPALGGDSRFSAARKFSSDFNIQLLPIDIPSKSRATAAAAVEDDDGGDSKLDVFIRSSRLRSDAAVPSSRRSSLQKSKSQLKLLSQSVIRIAANGHLVKHEELKAMKEMFDRLDKNKTGYVEYSKLAEGNGRTLFSQSLLKKVSTAAECDDPERPQGVFSFRDMLAISYPFASPDELNEMDEYATKGASAERLRKARENATARERAEAEDWFEEISRDSNDLIFLDSLEDFLNTKCPFMNVYQYLKTMDPPILERLYADEPMTKDEFIYWHLTNAVATRTAAENIKKVKQGSGMAAKARPGALLKQLRGGGH